MTMIVFSRTSTLHSADDASTDSLNAVTVLLQLRGHQEYPKYKLNTIQLIRLALKIRPVRLNRSIYVRIPNDIADLIGIKGDTEVTLKLEDARDEFCLIYRIPKRRSSVPNEIPVLYADQKGATATRTG
jgi:hypothetical protein